MARVVTPEMLDATRAEMIYEGKALIDALADFIPDEMGCNLSYGLDSDYGVYFVKKGDDLDTIFVHVYFDAYEQEGEVIIATSGYSNYMWVVKAMEAFCKRFDINVKVSKT